MYRFLFLIALGTVCHCGCASIFNPDSAIDAAIAAYSGTDHSFSIDDESTPELRDKSGQSNDDRRAERNLNVSAEIRHSQPEPGQNSNEKKRYQADERLPDRTAVIPQKSRGDENADSQSSWDKIEQSVLNPPVQKTPFQSLPYELSTQGKRQTDASLNGSDGNLGAAQEPENQGGAESSSESKQLIQIYDRKPIAHGKKIDDQQTTESYLPLIQRSVVTDVEIPRISFDRIFERGESLINNSKRSVDAKGVNWRDSLEAAGDHLREELKSGQIDEDDAKNLTVLLEVLDSFDGDNRSLVNLIRKIKDLKESLPPHHYSALRTVIAQTKIDGSSGPRLDDLFRQALDVVAKTSDLGIKKAVICNEVNGFGKFKPFESNRFRPGDEVLLYCEIENFSTELIDNDSGRVHQCEFNAQIQFVNEKGETDHVQSLAKITDQSKSNRRDFYILFRIRVPDLANGDHSLQVQIQDKVGRKTARLEQPIPFQIEK